MLNLEWLLLIAGLLHFSLLLAGGLAVHTLNWRSKLTSLDTMSRQLIWVHAGFIVLVIISFGVLSVSLSSSLASGSPVARGVCAMIATFWFVRLILQLAYFDARALFRNWFYKVGYHALTVVFAYFTAVYGIACLAV